MSVKVKLLGTIELEYEFDVEISDLDLGDFLKDTEIDPRSALFEAVWDYVGSPDVESYLWEATPQDLNDYEVYSANIQVIEVEEIPKTS